MMLQKSIMLLFGGVCLAACGNNEPSEPTQVVPDRVSVQTAESEDGDESNEDTTDETGNEDSTDEADNDSTPAEPEPAPVDQVEADYVAFENGLRAYPKERRVELDAWLLGGHRRPLEYLLVLPGGNAHESLFATGARGLHLKRALEVIGLEEGEVKRSGRGYLDPPEGDRVKLSVRFEHADTGEQTTVPVEEWLWDAERDDHPAEVGFIFTGGHEDFRPEHNRSNFEADQKGNLIALWRDASTLLDNDRERAYVPDIYSPHEDADGMPKVRRGETPKVKLIFEPWEE